jgi:hypothetical protein
MGMKRIKILWKKKYKILPLKVNEKKIYDNEKIFVLICLRGFIIFYKKKMIFYMYES